MRYIVKSKSAKTSQEAAEILILEEVFAVISLTDRDSIKIYSKKKRKCNCDQSRFYIGKEPSPKGLGFCAHCTPLNVTMKGLDGNLWENQKYSKGKRWVKVRVDMN